MILSEKKKIFFNFAFSLQMNLVSFNVTFSCSLSLTCKINSWSKQIIFHYIFDLNIAFRAILLFFHWTITFVPFR